MLDLLFKGIACAALFSRYRLSRRDGQAGKGRTISRRSLVRTHSTRPLLLFKGIACAALFSRYRLSRRDGQAEKGRTISRRPLVRPHSTRPLLIVVSSPDQAPPLPSALDEAVSVSQQLSASILRTCSALQLQHELLRTPTECLLFTGHGDGLIAGQGQYTLPLTTAVGGMELVQSISLANLLAPVRKLVVLNSCYTLEVGRLLRRHVPYVLCYRTLVCDAAAKVLAVAFFKSFAQYGRTIEQAFEDAKNAVTLETRDFHGVSVPRYELTDPRSFGPHQRHLPIAAGIPVLLCEHGEL